MSHAWEDIESGLYQSVAPETLVCSACVTDGVLWERVAATAHSDVCDFCAAEGPCVSFADLEPVVTGAIEQFYVTFSESGAWHEAGEPSEVVEDVRDIVGDLLYAAVEGQVAWALQTYVASNDDTDYGWVAREALWATVYDFDAVDWRDFMAKAREGAPESAEAMLTDLKREVRALFTKIAHVAEQQGLFTEASPTLWRGRAASADAEYRTSQQLGSAPAGLAGAGRLNMSGHSYFYGGTTRRGAVRELTKHCGADAAIWLGEFTPSRPIYHLDLMELPPDGSPFASDAGDTRDALAFLREFAETISQPNDPADKAHYLPTQLFAAYLIADIDGPEAIRFRSSLDDASENWIVFSDQEHCVDLAAPGGDDLYLILSPSSVERVVASDVL